MINADQPTFLPNTFPVRNAFADHELPRTSLLTLDSNVNAEECHTACGAVVMFQSITGFTSDGSEPEKNTSSLGIVLRKPFPSS